MLDAVIAGQTLGHADATKLFEFDQRQTVESHQYNNVLRYYGQTVNAVIRGLAIGVASILRGSVVSVAIAYCLRGVDSEREKWVGKGLGKASRSG